MIDCWKGLVDSVPGSELVLPGRGSPAFYAVGWHNRHQGQISLVGAYDLQSRTGINKWTPWAYDCVYEHVPLRGGRSHGGACTGAVARAGLRSIRSDSPVPHRSPDTGTRPGSKLRGH